MAKALGIDDSVNTCDCCGKTNLKCTVTIQLDNGEIVHYGRTCASRNTGKTAQVIAAEIKTHEAEQIAAARAEWINHPARIAEKVRFAERPAGMLGRAAADFVRDAVNAANAVRNEIAAKYGVHSYKFAM